MLIRLIYSIFSSIEFIYLLLIGKILGVSVIVRYLRNPNPSIVVSLLKAFGAKIGKDTTFKQSVLIDNALGDKDSTGDFRHLTIGENCYIGDGVYFDLSNRIDLGNQVVISGQVRFITHSDCNRSQFLNLNFPRKSLPVMIKNDVWLGFGVIVLPGIVVNQKSVVGAGSVIASNVEETSLYLGLPAKRIRSIEK